ncbi:bifunctional phosphoribosyl-AMP cyclohydrolase/phosphoribosyl-ATP diphosphatase HisIE [Candidatus Sororendozoicomonas aggregata]|uniref:bifunctional phosphoribosyl-AMP cyclohydrolase/phosphoribosyl-ATP diphosphatase HisIE n=1 Tax=Candidatus Sororendozoicomonas aggregata TaxID=3073239 RepID=UPI002ED07B59
MSLATDIDWEKSQGLIPAVIQDTVSKNVLMLGYMNKEALAVTLETGKVTFWSRTKQRLWTKGETSGNTLLLNSVALDCDNDTLLVMAKATGPTCHKGTTTCFDSAEAGTTLSSIANLTFLTELENLLADRKKAAPDSSYTASLYAQGAKRIAQKVGEEGVEVALAAVAGDRKELINESADLMYHLLVLLQSQQLSLSDVITTLIERHQVR